MHHPSFCKIWELSDKMPINERENQNQIGKFMGFFFVNYDLYNLYIWIRKPKLNL